jgi:hypothetical protein
VRLLSHDRLLASLIGVVEARERRLGFFVFVMLGLRQALSKRTRMTSSLCYLFLKVSAVTKRSRDMSRFFFPG